MQGIDEEDFSKEFIGSQENFKSHNVVSPWDDEGKYIYCFWQIATSNSLQIFYQSLGNFLHLHAKNVIKNHTKRKSKKEEARKGTVKSILNV